MAIINTLVLIGNLTRDAELKYTNGGTATVRGSIAQNRSKKDGEGWTDVPQFFDFMLMGRSAESVHKHLVKGKQIALQGELRQDRWEKDGQPQSKVYMFAFSVQLLGSPGQSKTYQGGQPAEQPSQVASEVFDDEEIPF